MLNYLDPPSLAPLITVLSVTLALVVAGDVLRFNWPAFARYVFSSSPSKEATETDLNDGLTFSFCRVYESKLGVLMRSEERVRHPNITFSFHPS